MLPVGIQRPPPAPMRMRPGARPRTNRYWRSMRCDFCLAASEGSSPSCVSVRPLPLLPALAASVQAASLSTSGRRAVIPGPAAWTAPAAYASTAEPFQLSSLQCAPGWLASMRESSPSPSSSPHSVMERTCRRAARSPRPLSEAAAAANAAAGVASPRTPELPLPAASLSLALSPTSSPLLLALLLPSAPRLLELLPPSEPRLLASLPPSALSPAFPDRGLALTSLAMARQRACSAASPMVASLAACQGGALQEQLLLAALPMPPEPVVRPPAALPLSPEPVVRSPAAPLLPPELAVLSGSSVPTWGRTNPR